MNLNDDDEEDSFFTQHCFELAKLLRTEQTEHFLHLYDSLPSEWNGARLEEAKESIRRLQELDENEFDQLYERVSRQQQSNLSTNDMSKQSPIVRNDDNHTMDQTISSTSRITSLAILQQKQHLERTTANNLACDEQHDLPSKHSSNSSKNSTRQLQSITNNNNNSPDMISTNNQTHVPVDSFVQLNLKPSVEISLQDYKKARVLSPTAKPRSINARTSLSQSKDVHESHTNSNNAMKKQKKSLANQYHEEASLDYFFKKDEDDRQPSRSSSSSSSSTASIPMSSKAKTDSTQPQLLPRERTTKSSSENSGSARTGSASDSDDERRSRLLKKTELFSATKPTLLSTSKSFQNDAIPTIMLNATNDHRPAQHDRFSTLPAQDSYELVHLTSNPNNNNHSSNDILSYTTQRPQANNLLSSSQQNQNSEHYDQYNANDSNSSRKSTTRTSKKRKQLQQQETIRTELIPGHRGDRDVDELVMFIDGNSSTKQRQNSASLRSTDTNSNTTRRKSRKSVKEAFVSTTDETKASHVDEHIQSISFVDEDQSATTAEHSVNNVTNEQNTTGNSLPNEDELHSSPNATNGEISATEWLEPVRSTTSVTDDNDSLSLSTAALNNSINEIASEPFVTVTHRRRLTKERRQDSNPSSSSSSRTSHLPSSSTNDKRRFMPQTTLQNGTARSKMRVNGPSNVKSSNSPSTIEETAPSAPQSVFQTSTVPPASSSAISNNVADQLSPRLSSHSSSSSITSSLKRPSKPPPVVFFNKSEDVQLNGVSFGFDIENPLVDKFVTETLSSSSSLPPTPSSAPLSAVDKEQETPSSTPPIDPKTSSSRRSYQQQRSNRGQVFNSGSDFHSHQHNNQNYPSQTTPLTQSSYVDPLLFLQYNQQRLISNYSQPFPYMSMARPPYISSQTQYYIIPTGYTTSTTNDATTATGQDENTSNDDDNETAQSSEHAQAPLLFYTAISAPMYLQPMKKGPSDLEQPVPIPPMYAPPYYYPTQTPHAAYFQPITPASLLIESKSQQDDSDNEDGYESSTRLFHQSRQQSSSHIMSNALQLVYSQERRNAPTDRFNLDQLTAYLAMKWTDAVGHYEQGKKPSTSLVTFCSY
ncbi:unnamed protein product [Adineta ricciae]|uniref:Uncharacterized protein n=1 Tax=Adineta ricciae TaxID=249248 RepID=A0A814K9E1_ADIRI|nr:unnamed protein product [Adineta ricciae]